MKYKYSILQVDKLGRELEISFQNLKDFKKMRDIPKDLFLNNPLIDDFKPGNTYYGNFNRDLKDGLHLVYNDLEIVEYAFFKDGLLVDIPINKLLFLKLFFFDFKGFYKIVKDYDLDLNLSTPDEFMRLKKGFKYSLIEETLLSGNDKGFEFFKFLIDKVDLSNYNIFAPYNGTTRKQNIVKLAIEYDNWKALQLISDIFPNIITNEHQAIFYNKNKQLENSLNKSQKIFQLIDKTLLKEKNI